MSKRNGNNWIDLSSLPKMGGKDNKIAWKKVNNVNVDFCYEGVYGTLKIIKPLPNSKCLILYNDKEIEVLNDALRNCQLLYVVGMKTRDFKYQIGEIVDTKEGKIKILKQYRKHRLAKHKDRIVDKYNKCYDMECLVCHGVIEEFEEAELDSLVKCPFCSGYRILVGFNDMWTTAPEIARLLKDPEDGYKYTRCSNKKLEWLCPDCDETVTAKPCEIYRANGKLPCKRCGGGQYYPNRFMFNLLTSLHVDFEPEKSFDWSNSKRYDFYLPQYNLIIEMHGIQHYIDVGFGRDFKIEQENDRYKEALAKSNGIKKYIVIDCSKSSPTYIYNNILNSELTQFINVSNVDITAIHTESMKKYLYVVIDALKANDDDVVAAAKQLKTSDVSIYNYLAIAEEIGIYHHDKAKARQKRNLDIVRTHYQKYGKPFICIENEYAFGNGTALEDNAINVFNRRMVRSCISEAACKGSKAYGYHWKYITHEEFNNIKSKSPDKAFGDFFDLELDETNKSA